MAWWIFFRINRATRPGAVVVVLRLVTSPTTPASLPQSILAIWMLRSLQRHLPRKETNVGTLCLLVRCSGDTTDIVFLDLGMSLCKNELVLEGSLSFLSWLEFKEKRIASTLATKEYSSATRLLQ